MEQERRSFPRRPAKGDVYCRLDRLGMGPPHRGKLLDISQSGARFSLSVSIDVGQEVHLEFSTKRSGRPFTTTVTVIWTAELEDQGWQISAELHSRMPYQCCLELTR